MMYKLTVIHGPEYKHGRTYCHSSGMLSSTGRHAVIVDADGEVFARATSSSILLSSLMTRAVELPVAACILLSSPTTCAAVLSPCAVRESSRAASALVRTTLTLTAARRFCPPRGRPLLVLGVAWSAADVSLLLLPWWRWRFVLRRRVLTRIFME